jgi:isomerase DpgB
VVRPADLTVDGASTLTAATVDSLRALCDRVEDGDGGLVVLHVSGTPAGRWSDALTVALVGKWERQLRRLECIPATTVAVAHGDCGGPSLDVLLATDHRIAAPPARLIVPAADGATWPGMAVYRLATQTTDIALVRRAVLRGTPIDAATALAAHLFDEVTTDVASSLAALASVASTLSGPELAVRRRLLLEAGTATFEDALGAHLAACDRMLRRVDAGAAT